MKEEVFAVIVTYGDRFYFLKHVTDACFNEGVNKIIVVDNNSAEKSKKQLKALAEKEDRLKVIFLPENKGSAGGFKRGLEEAYKDCDCEFIWLLDDDNKPLEGSLQSLLHCWNGINISDKESNLALLSWRKNKEFVQIKAIAKKNPCLVLGSQNSFLGFHINQLPLKVARVIRRMFFKEDFNVHSYLTFLEENNIKYGQVAVAPYGGLFIHKRILEKIGYPDERFFTYADDHEWTYRITKYGGKIYLCWKSQMVDLEMSWHIKDKRLTVFEVLLRSGEDFRAYYAVRNRVAFEVKNLVSSSLVYNLNKLFFLSLLYLLSVLLNKKGRFKLIKRAVEDGLRLAEDKRG